MKIAVSALLLVSIHVAGGWAEAQDLPLSSQVKSAYLLNFARFVDWPGEAFVAGTPFVLCAGGQALPKVLETTIRGESVNGRPIQLRRITAPAQVKGCHLLYVSGPQSTAMLRAAGSLPVLTVGETADFIKNGGMIRFLEMTNRIRFEINQMAAEQRGLRVSSRLLRLADIVEVGP